MRFTITALASMAAAASATVIPRADYGSWNVTLSHTGGNDRGQSETVSGVFASAELADNIPVSCRYEGIVDGVYNPTITCDPESFSYKFEDAGYDDGYLFQLTLKQTVTIAGTEVTVQGVSDKFKTVGDGVTGKAFTASNIIVKVSTGIA